MSDSNAAANPASPAKPAKEPTLKVIPMPADTNALGKIFGGWLMSHMDLACAQQARESTRQIVVTVGARVNFVRPVEVGDNVSFYTWVIKVGTTSITVGVEARAYRSLLNIDEKVGDGEFVFVAIDQKKNKIPIRTP